MVQRADVARAKAWAEWEREQILANLKRREEKALEVLEEHPDDKGRLFGEKNFSEIEEGEDGPDWEAINRHLPDFRTPEVILANREICQIALANVQLLGEETHNLFLAWLDHATPENLVSEFDLSYQEIMWRVRAAVRKCREVFGTDPKVFPFSSLKGKARKTLKNRLWLQRYREGAAPIDPGKAVYLTPDERALSLDALTALLKGRGVPCSRGNVWRVQKRGWYYPKYDHAARIAASRVEVSEEDRKLPATVLARKMGISHFTARSAKTRGWFMRNSQNQHLVPDSTATIRRPGPKSKELTSEQTRLLMALPERVSTTPDGRAISQLSVTEICKVFGLPVGGNISKVRKRGWFSTRTWKVQQRLAFIRRMGFVDLATAEGRVEARVKLAQCDFDGWQKKVVHCALCGDELPLGEATIDHIVPKAQGGGDYLSNLQLAHEACNKAKGGMAFGTLGEALKKAKKDSI